MKYSEAVTIIDNEKTRTDITTRSHIWIWKCKDIEGHAGEKGNKSLASPLVVIYYKTLDPLGGIPIFTKRENGSMSANALDKGLDGGVTSTYESGGQGALILNSN